MFFCNGSPVSWQAKTQPTTACSSGYAEIIASYNAACEAVWGRSFLLAFGFEQQTPVTILSDNETAIVHSKDHMITPRNKAFSTKYHWVREQCSDGTIALKHVAGNKNIADIFTKPLPKIKFEYFRNQIGVRTNCVELDPELGPEPRRINTSRRGQKEPKERK